MEKIASWNPFEDWQHRTIDWLRLSVPREDLRRFTTRSDLKGLFQAILFLLFFTVIGSLACWAFICHAWGWMILALFIHGTFYSKFGNALHELSHGTVFASKRLNDFFTFLYGWLYWPYNPYFYRLSHVGYHHRYTLYQKSDGEDVPNYVDLSPRFILRMTFNVISIRQFIWNLGRLVTGKPTSKDWRGRQFRLDPWERFIFENATEEQRRNVLRFGRFCLISHLLFILICVYAGVWFIPILITLAPFYGTDWHAYICGVHQHAACEANSADFCKSCGDAKLDLLSSFLLWRMEYHIEHHMFASIPCYNLPAFSRYLADRLPDKEHALPRVIKLHRLSKEKFGTPQQWRDQFGFYKGL